MSLSHLPCRRSVATFAVFTILLLASASASASTIEAIGGEESRVESGRLLSSERVLPQRRLVGPGSSPPTCISKCGRCLPCKPVLVTIPPVQILPSDEYRPEVWRCKCGDKLYIP